MEVGGGAAIRVRNSVITGTTDLLNGKVSVYQNEIGTKLTIEATVNIESVVLIDMTGRIYTREITTVEDGLNEVDISTVPKGLYVVRVKTRSKIHSVKIIH